MRSVPVSNPIGPQAAEWRSGREYHTRHAWKYSESVLDS